MILKLKKPLLIDGEKKSEIEYDLDDLTGADIDAAVRSLKMSGVSVTSVELDPSYHAALFAQSAGISYEDMKRMGAKDYSNAVIAVRDFFLDDSGESLDKTPSDK